MISNELKSIVKLDLIKTEINNINIRNDYFDIEEKIGSTIWKNVFRLPAANHLTASLNNSKLHKYWTLHYQKNNLFKNLDSS